MYPDAIACWAISHHEIQSLIKAGIQDEIISLFRAKYFTIKSKDWNDPEADKLIYFIVKNDNYCRSSGRLF